MKKKLLVFLTIFALVLSMTSLLAQAAEDAEVTVTVNEDGTVTVTATGTFDENDWVGIYKQGDTVDPRCRFHRVVVSARRRGNHVSR